MLSPLVASARIFVVSSVVLVAGHASMPFPPTRQTHGKNITCGNEGCNAGCFESACLWYQVGCMVGCDTCSLDGKEMWPTPESVHCKRNGTPVAPGKTPFSKKTLQAPRSGTAEAIGLNMDFRIGTKNMSI